MAWRTVRLVSGTLRRRKKASPPMKRPSGRSRIKVAKVASISWRLLALNTWICKPRERAAPSRSFNVSAILGLAGLTRTAMRAAVGTNSRRSPIRFAVNSVVKKLTPVRFPPGRARLAMRPKLTGSWGTAKTIGIVAVAAFAAAAVGMPPPLAITATWRRTRSAASAGNRSYWPSAQRYTIVTFSCSTKPVSLRPWRNARSRSPMASGDLVSRKPITGIADCCARAVSGHAAAPPRSVMNSRRLMLIMGISSPPASSGYLSYPCGDGALRAVFFTLSLAHGGRQVLGPVLNRSESGLDAALVNPNSSTSQRGKSAALRGFNLPNVGSGSCVTSNAGPNGVRNCTRDEGGPFEFGNQVLISSHRKLLSSKAMVVNVAETSGQDPGRHGRERRAQANRCRSVESGLDDVKTGG